MVNLLQVLGEAPKENQRHEAAEAEEIFLCNVYEVILFYFRQGLHENRDIFFSISHPQITNSAGTIGVHL